MEDLEYIKKFSKITVKSVCDKTSVDKSNLFSGRTSKENIKKVREQIESEVAKLYLKKGEVDYDNS